MATERITFTLNTDDPRQRRLFEWIAAQSDRSAAIRNRLLECHDDEPSQGATNADPNIAQVVENNTQVMAAILNWMTSGAVPVSLPEYAPPVEDDSEDADDPLVKAMAGIKFEF